MNNEVASNTFFDKHPKTTITILLLFFTCIIGLIGEFYLRATIDYHIGYYTGVRKPGVVEYPFGEILINSDGQPDTEFDLKDSKPRIGYIGDSVNYGTGTGYGYRVSDLLEKAKPEFQHMTIGTVGFDIHGIDKIISKLDKFNFNTVIYLMNLNDILPEITSNKNKASNMNKVSKVVTQTIDYFRGKSYLYNYLRTSLKNSIQRMGYSYGGHKAFELHPEQYKDIFEGTAERTNAFGELLASKGIKFCVLLLPYEMQISNSAAKKYKALGFNWDNDFVTGSSQRLISKYLDTKKYETLDGYFAFIDPKDEETSKNNNKLGQFFVYNKGDKIDWNHPNREGHRKLAEYMLEKNFCSTQSVALK